MEGLRERGLDIALVLEPPTGDDPDLKFAQVLKHDNFIAACARAGFIPDITMEATEPLAALGLVAAGLGMTMLQQSLCHQAPSGVVLHELSWFSLPYRAVGGMAQGQFVAAGRDIPPNLIASQRRASRNSQYRQQGAHTIDIGVSRAPAVLIALQKIMLR